MKLKSAFSFTFGAVLSLSSVTWASIAVAQTASVPTDQNTIAPAGSELVNGEIRKVDKASGKLTIKHGPIKSLDMPSMTMVYPVRAAPLLDKVKAGDKARFRLENLEGKFVVTEIEPAH